MEVQARATLSVRLISSSSSGFGQEIARAVLTRGWNAAVTARDITSVGDIVEGRETQALALPLDVTQPTQIAGAVQTTLTRFGAIDVLVNNAGYGYRVAVEEADNANIRLQFETNFWVDCHNASNSAGYARGRSRNDHQRLLGWRSDGAAKVRLLFGDQVCR